MLAFAAIQNSQISSIREAARRFSVPRSSLQRRLNGDTFRAEQRANNHKLTEFEEISLLQWVLSMDSRKAAPRPAMAQEMANILLAQRCQQRVGQNWVYKFAKRHDELKTRFSRRYNYERAKCEDPKVIEEWFQCVRRTIAEHGIQSDDIYNFDETGFEMGLISTARVVTREYYDRRKGITTRKPRMGHISHLSRLSTRQALCFHHALFSRARFSNRHGMKIRLYHKIGVSM